MQHRVQGQDLLETEPCEHREMTIGSQFKGRDEHGALQCDLQRCCVGQGHSSTGHAAPYPRHAAGSQRPPVISGVGMDRTPAKRAAEELHGASGKSCSRTLLYMALTEHNSYVCNLPYSFLEALKRGLKLNTKIRHRRTRLPSDSRIQSEVRSKSAKPVETVFSMVLTIRWLHMLVWLASIVLAHLL